MCYREGWDWHWWTWAQLADAASEQNPGDSPVASGDPGAVAALVAGDRDDGGSARAGRSRLAEPPPLAPPGRWRRALGVPSREVVVEVFPTSSETRIDWLRWALGRGAALVAAPSRESWLEVVLFARPTLLWGGAEEARALLDRARGRRRTLDRLRAFAWTDSDGVPSGLAARFAALEVAWISPLEEQSAAAGGLPVATR